MLRAWLKSCFQVSISSKNKRKLKSNFVDRVAYGEKSNANCEPFGFFEGLLASYYKSVQELGQTKIETFLPFQVVLL